MLYIYKQFTFFFDNIYEKSAVKYNSLLPVDEISAGATAIGRNKWKVNKNCQKRGPKNARTDITENSFIKGW